MTVDISITLSAKDERNQDLIRRLAAAELKRRRALPERPDGGADFSLRLLKRSLDARHGRQKVHLRLRASTGGTPEAAEPADGSAQPVWKDADGRHAVVIVGAGPAGLFGALKLLEYGIRPVVVERGAETAARKRDIAKISTQGLVDGDSNYCFGEGGAGTFSDGKLYTRSKKRGSVGAILSLFVRFGADKRILTDAHPHIGTDRLPLIVNAVREEIIRHGGEFHFRTRCTGFLRNADGRISGITAERTDGGGQVEFRGDAVVLASGHSASDIYKLIAKAAPAALEAKTFAAGVRVEHPRALIDSIQYHGRSGGLPAAEYRLAAQVEGRGVYSFCMCPGGFVVPSATGPEEIVVNGMSAAARNSNWSNAAIVVETRPEDVPEEFRREAADAGCHALAGLLFRTALERETKRRGSGQSAPAQRLTDFLAEAPSDTLPSASYTPGVVPSRLDRWLPPHIARRLSAGFRAFGRNMRGFVCRDALLIASETRTSTPVRILRDGGTFECAALAGLYPAGEGSGYSGGIVSSALDGQNVCRAVAEQLLNGAAR